MNYTTNKLSFKEQRIFIVKLYNFHCVSRITIDIAIFKLVIQFIIGNDFILSRKYDIFFLTKENSTRLFDLFLSFPLRIQNYTGATTLGKESSENMGDLHWPRLIRTFPPEVLDDKLFPSKNRVPFEIQREILLRYVSAVHARVRHIACEDRGSGDRCIYNRGGWKMKALTMTQKRPNVQMNLQRCNSQ